MVKKTIKFTDFDGNEQTETCYFNLSKMDFFKLDKKYPKGLKEAVNEIAESQNVSDIFSLVDDVILSSYGQRSGTRFIKNEEMRKDFESSLAYEALIDEFLQDPDSLRDFLASLTQGMRPEIQTV